MTEDIVSVYQSLPRYLTRRRGNSRVLPTDTETRGHDTNTSFISRTHVGATHKHGGGFHNISLPQSKQGIKDCPSGT